MVKFYQVGGCVRDALLGRKCKDIDYSVEAQSYEEMYREIVKRGGEVFLESPQYLTIRAKVPGMGACDFVLCRKDGVYYDGRHPESVEPGSIYDDLARRDFTMNAIAMDEDGNTLDPHNGMIHLYERVIHCVGDARQRFEEDALRLLRALRFAVVLGFELDDDIHYCLSDCNMAVKLRQVSVERIREELLKAFKSSTLVTLAHLEEYPRIADVVFENGLWLMPTLRS
jgi:tRNA nucleotidyltransferase (CCA-adding enzyme)